MATASYLRHECELCGAHFWATPSMIEVKLGTCKPCVKMGAWEAAAEIYAKGIVEFEEYKDSLGDA